MDPHRQPSDRGRDDEGRTCRFLLERRLTLIIRHYRCRHGEIDLILRDRDGMVLLDVHNRGSRRFACGAGTVDHRKRVKLAAIARMTCSAIPPRRRARRALTSSPSRRYGRVSLHWIPNASGVEA